MAAMDKLTPEIMQMIGNLREMNYRQKVNGTADAKTDKYGFAFEPYDAFSADPLDFLETSMRLEAETTELFSLVCKVNRHSPLFAGLSGQLEKAVSLLGGCCITKAVLEQQEGDIFELLEDLTVGSLRGMAAFNLRKCYAAFMESRAAGRFCPDAFSLSLRWAALDRRLQATADKIEKIKAGKIRIDLSENKLSAAPLNDQSEDDERPAAALPAKGSALPIDKAAVREAEKRRTAEEAAPAETEAAETAAVIPETDEEPESGNDRFVRHILMQDAVDRADREAYEAACTEDGPALEALWKSFLIRDGESGFAVLKKMGIAVQAEDPPPEEEGSFADVYEMEAA